MRLAVVVFTALLASACGEASKPAAETKPEPSPSQSAQSSDMEQAQQFLNALTAKDLAKLRAYDAAGDDFFNPDGSMRDDIETALYGPMGSDSPGPIPAMAAQGEFKIQPVDRAQGEDGGRVVSVMFFSKAFRPDEEAKDFWDREWLKSYFSCEFNVKSGRWTLRETFCFVPGGAPYHGRYDEL